MHELVGPKLTPYPQTVLGKRGYLLTEDFVYRNIKVFKGFFTDGATIPRLLWRIMGHPFMSLYVTAAVIHDFLYSNLCELNINREQADLIFLEILEKWGVGPIKRKTIYRAVRLFGGKHWKNPGVVIDW